MSTPIETVAAYMVAGIGGACIAASVYYLVRAWRASVR